jgi:tetratricopeptide (TPR) repeat protein
MPRRSSLRGDSSGPMRELRPVAYHRMGRPLGLQRISVNRQQLLIFGLLALLVVVQAESAAILKGEIRANELGGQPVPNVSVRADGADPAVSDTEGRFVLTFPNLRPGHAVNVSVIRDGWSVLNDVELEHALPATPDTRRLTVVISRSSERHERALQYYRLRGREAVDAEYLKKIQDLQGSQASNLKERNQLGRERDQAQEQTDELARQLAETMPDEFAVEVRQARQLFLEGRVDAALKLLESGKLNQQSAQAKEAVAREVQGYLLRGKLLTVKLRFDEASAAYDDAVRLAPNDGDAHFARAVFNKSLNRLGPSRQAYERALAIYREDAKTNHLTYSPSVAKTLVNLGNVHNDQRHSVDARAAYEQALGIYRKLASINTAPDIAGGHR